jgi:hypothetical protein
VGRKPSPNSSRADDPFQAKHAARGRRLGLLVYVAAAGLALWNAHVGLALSADPCSRDPDALTKGGREQAHVRLQPRESLFRALILQLA